ncbi:hypothetical protein J2800_001450 [Caulobacter rhizosphaerae]|uniref:EH signature protein n=1 Tax=Caulobacter rhizosphaerae TaxID=2010972 RepID=A0ABU1MXT1_9CAUL|nr:hypothetical protein [Caulobacter rhizosphaerae]MDR6530711.1 hypothetical protein [Caulobacter rhizosphaerae]
MTPEPDLQTALDAVYAAFRHYSRPGTLEAAPTRDPKRVLARLSARNLAELTSDDINGYMGWAMTTIGGVNDYKHFLPRILELAVQGTGRVHVGGDPESLAGKIAYGEFSDWPADERAAIVTAFDAAWRQALRTSLEEEEAEDWLRGLITLGEPIQTRLTAWLETSAPLAGLHLADAVCSEILRRKDARPPFGSSDEYVPYKAYSAWLAGPSVRERLECLASEIDDDEEAWRLRQALDGPMPPYPEVWRG